MNPCKRFLFDESFYRRKSSDMAEVTKCTFTGKMDRYAGVTVDSTKEPCPIDQFTTILSGKFVFELMFFSWVNRSGTSLSYLPKYLKNDKSTALSQFEKNVICLQTKLFDLVTAESLKTWKKDGKRCVWFKVDLGNSEWIPHLTKVSIYIYYLDIQILKSIILKYC